MHRPRILLNLWLTLFAIWLIANDSLDGEVVLTGALLAAAIAWVFASLGPAYADIRLTPRTLLYYLGYLGVFAWELVKANLHVARIVLSPTIAIQPGIVEVKTRLKSPTGRLVLANSITLTPGTLVVDIEGDSLFVHWIDVETDNLEGATRSIAARFERYLSVIYG